MHEDVLDLYGRRTMRAGQTVTVPRGLADELCRRGAADRVR
jgi:hypothetical protein